MKSVSNKIGYLFLVIGVLVAFMGFSQLKHPEIVIDNSEMRIEDLGFGNSGKHPEIVEVTTKDKVNYKLKFEI